MNEITEYSSEKSRAKFDLIENEDVSDDVMIGGCKKSKKLPSIQSKIKVTIFQSTKEMTASQSKFHFDVFFKCENENTQGYKKINWKVSKPL